MQPDQYSTLGSPTARSVVGAALELINPAQLGASVPVGPDTGTVEEVGTALLGLPTPPPVQYTGVAGVPHCAGAVVHAVSRLSPVTVVLEAKRRSVETKGDAVDTGAAVVGDAVVGACVVGFFEGEAVGLVVGLAVGLRVGDLLGLRVGALDGPSVGWCVGVLEGLAEGVFVGERDGCSVGEREGEYVGEAEARDVPPRQTQSTCLANPHEPGEGCATQSGLSVSLEPTPPVAHVALPAVQSSQFVAAVVPAAVVPDQNVAPRGRTAASAKVRSMSAAAKSAARLEATGTPVGPRNSLAGLSPRSNTVSPVYETNMTASAHARSVYPTSALQKSEEVALSPRWPSKSCSSE